ncbi:uncharacterized protein PV07_01138 [Cladophialophora immunda]|uniref:Uncharacterized protein n=1 Tax=Cladophialophora immunda TaxID=569365 RepID=A0A0D2DF72_9EURO|nr:uncharacterized protein PV07_01138 [Cladophialophora immunda]KIW34359.1 hypothetical protein PV07_01138 [Cladophialophora immunda]
MVSPDHRSNSRRNRRRISALSGASEPQTLDPRGPLRAEDPTPHRPSPRDRSKRENQLHPARPREPEVRAASGRGCQDTPRRGQDRLCDAQRRDHGAAIRPDGRRHRDAVRDQPPGPLPPGQSPPEERPDPVPPRHRQQLGLGAQRRVRPPAPARRVLRPRPRLRPDASVHLLQGVRDPLREAACETPPPEPQGHGRLQPEPGEHPHEPPGLHDRRRARQSHRSRPAV